MYLVSAYFDDETTNILGRYIQRIAECSQNDFMIRNQVPPHLTIAAFDAKAADGLEDMFYDVTEDILNCDINIVSIGMLLPHVIYATPVLNEDLRRIHQQIFKGFSMHPDIRWRPYYQPGNWLPHITMGKTLTEVQLKAGVECMVRHFRPREARITRLGLSQTNPYRDIRNVKLQ